MKKTILLYGALAGALIALLSLIEYRYLIIDHSIEIYGALVALVFTVAGIWLGLRLTSAREKIVIREVEVPVMVDRSADFAPSQASLDRLGIISGGHRQCCWDRRLESSPERMIFFAGLKITHPGDAKYERFDVFWWRNLKLFAMETYE